MIRAIGLCLITLFMAAPALAAESLAGTWRQETEGIGVSYWELTPKGEHAYDAQEYGLAGKKGVARLEGDHLVIHIEDEGGRATYDWHLQGTSGHGKLVQHIAGGEEKIYEHSSVRFIGK